MSGKIRLNGSTSGFSEITAPAVAGDQTFTLPAAGGNIAVVGSNIPWNRIGTDLSPTDIGDSVGIGTTNPASKLDVRGGTIRCDSDSDNYQVFANNGFTRGVVQVAPDGDGLDIKSTLNNSGYISASTVTGGALAERLRIDNAGRLLIGTTTNSGSQLLQMIGGSSATADVFIGNSVASTGQTATITFAPANSIAGAQIISTAEEDFTTGANRTARLSFSTRLNGTLQEKMRITPNGRLLLGTTTESAISTAQQLVYTNGITNVLLANNSSGGWNCLNSQVSNGGTYYYHGFMNNSTLIGSITSTNGTTVTYAQNSDYRLKENVVDIADGITRLKQLQPRRFNFIVDPDTTFDGFIAHEAQTVVPECATGTKDEVDENGNPVHQGIDQSKLVPLLTTALQEAITKIETLETQNTDLLARVTALEVS